MPKEQMSPPEYIPGPPTYVERRIREPGLPIELVESPEQLEAFSIRAPRLIPPGEGQVTDAQLNAAEVALQGTHFDVPGEQMTGGPVEVIEAAQPTREPDILRGISGNRWSGGSKSA